MKNDTAINIVLPKELKDRVKEKAKAKSLSVNSLVRLVLSEYLERN